jgi:hypothetical protein
MVLVKDTSSGKKLKLSTINGAFTFYGHTVDIVFHFFILNESETTVNEAELVFPLVEGSYVCGYAVDIDGVLVDAQIVNKEKARKTYEEESKTFHKSKTSIVEQEGNNYKIKFNSILPNSTRQIRISIIDKLEETGESIDKNYYNHVFPFELNEETKITITSNLLNTSTENTTNSTNFTQPTIFLEGSKYSQSLKNCDNIGSRYYSFLSSQNVACSKIRYVK